MNEDNCTEANCPVHTRSEKFEYDPTEKIERMIGISYVGDYCIYTDDDIDALPSDPMTLLAIVLGVMKPEHLEDLDIGYRTTIHQVGDGALLDSAGNCAAKVRSTVVNRSVQDAHDFHVRIVDAFTMNPVSGFEEYDKH